MPIEEGLIRRPTTVDTDSRFDYHCSYCDKEVSGRVVASYLSPRNNKIRDVVYLLCTSCTQGSVWSIKNNSVIPGSKPGKSLEGLPEEINKAYEEARKCFSVGAFTATELLCRKILMHIGVDKGAEEGGSFKSYIDFLEEKGYITPVIKNWADLIRTHGNESTHKLEPPNKKRTEATFMFLLQLLRIIYEMEFKAKLFDNSS